MIAALPEQQDLRNNLSPTSSYQVLRDARTQARNNERAALASGESHFIQAADWQLILEKAPRVLETESKDIEVTAWYIEALTRIKGFDGIAQGFSLARQLIETYGNALFPLPDEDGVATQLAPLIGLNGFGGEGALIAPIKSIPLTEGAPPGPLAAWQCEQVFELERISDADKKEARKKQGAVSREQLDHAVKETSTDFLRGLQQSMATAVSEYEKFQQVIDKYCQADPQPTGKILEALKSCQQVLTYIAGDRLKPIATVESSQSTEQNPGLNDVAIVDRSGGIQTRDDALALLRDVANYFRRAEPHSPISYSIEQAIRWSQLPLTDLIKELIPDDGARKKYQYLAGIAAHGGDD